MPQKLSIVIPVYNCQDHLAETLNSVALQTIADWECILIDDGSTDASIEVCEKYSFQDDRFRFYKRTGKYKPGGNGARNMGADVSHAEWLLFLDSDDLLVNNCLENRLTSIEMSRGNLDFLVNVTGTFYKKINDCQNVWNSYKNDETKKSLVKRFISQDSPWQTSALTWNRGYFFQIGKWEECLPCWQDWDIHLRALNRSQQFILKTEIDHYYRRNVANSIASSSTSEKYNAGVVQAILLVQRHGQWRKSERFFLYRLLILKLMKLNEESEYFKGTTEGMIALSLKRMINKPKISIKGILGRILYHLINFKDGNKCKQPLQ